LEGSWDYHVADVARGSILQPVDAIISRRS
jgi:hypothetical protein